MIRGGYILQPRTIDNSETAQFPPVTRELWAYLLRNVNHAKNERLNIDRGQGFFRLSDIQDDLKWFSGYRKNTYSKPQLTKSLRRLRESLMIETAKETRGLLITICNYDYYQNPENYEGNDERNAKEMRKKSKGHTINKNDKNDKNDNTDKPFRALDFLVDLGVKKNIAQDFLKCRKAKRLANTETAFTDIKREIEKKGLPANKIIKICTGKGWGGFKASWQLDGEEDQPANTKNKCSSDCFSSQSCKTLGKFKPGKECGAFNGHSSAGR
jgi:hypothetical protein